MLKRKQESIVTVSSLLLCLLLWMTQTACMGTSKSHEMQKGTEVINNDPEAPTETEALEREVTNAASPFSFTVRGEARKGKNNFFIITLTSNSDTLSLGSLRVAAAVSYSGTLRGSSAPGNKQGKGYKYEADLSHQHPLADLYLSNPKGPGDPNRVIGRGNKCAFRLKYEPGAEVEQGTNAVLTVTISTQNGGEQQNRLDFRTK